MTISRWLDAAKARLSAAGDLDAAAQFTGSEWIALIRQPPSVVTLLNHQIGTDCCVVAHTVKEKMRGRRKLILMSFPWRFRVSSKYGNSFIQWEHCSAYAVPAGSRKNRRLKSNSEGKLFEG